MSDEKPLTKKDLTSALRTALKDVPTKKEVFEMVSQVSEAILTSVDRMIQKIHMMVNNGFDKVQAGQKDLQRQVNDLRIDTPTKRNSKS